MSPSVLLILTVALYGLRMVDSYEDVNPQYPPLKLEEPPGSESGDHLVNAKKVSERGENSYLSWNGSKREAIGNEQRTANGDHRDTQRKDNSLGATTITSQQRARSKHEAMRDSMGIRHVQPELQLKSSERTATGPNENNQPVSARDGYGSSGHGGGSSLETALLTIAFLAFAVFIIQNLQNIIQQLTGGGGTGRSAVGRSSPSSPYSLEPDYSDLYSLDMVLEICHQFMAALYKYSQP